MITSIQKNTFRHRIPFFFTSDWADQPFLQRNRVTCGDGYEPPINPTDFAPEFFISIPWAATTTVSAVEIWNVDTGTLEQDLTTLFGLTGTTSQMVNEDGERIVVSFPGFPEFDGFFDALTCGTYQYRVTANSKKYYSDYFQVKSFSIYNSYEEKYITLYANADCFFAGMPWNEIPTYYIYAFLECPITRHSPEIEEEVQKGPDGLNTVVQSTIIHKYLGNILNVGWPLHQQLTAMQLYRPGESGEGVTFKMKRISTSDGLGDFTVNRFQLGQGNYGGPKCCPVVPVEFQVMEMLVNSGCCDTQYTPCYSDFTPPAPTLTLTGGDDVKIQFTVSPTLPIPDGAIPLNCWVDIYYRRVGTSIWSVVQDQSATVFTGGITITNFTTGFSYEFYAVCQNYNDSDCNSQNGTIATIVVP